MCVMCLFAVARFRVIENSFVVSLLHSSLTISSISLLYFCIRSPALPRFNRFSSPRPDQIQEERMFFYALRTSGKILLSKHLSIIRAALLTFELSNPSGRIKIVYTKTFIHSFVFLLHLLCR